jgi:hypothetical protein
MTYEEFAALAGYKPDGTPINAYTENGQTPNLPVGQLREMYSQSTGQASQPIWGTMGAPTGSYDAEAGRTSNGVPEVVNVNGVPMRRIGGDYTTGTLLEGGVQPVYDPTYGWLMKESDYQPRTNSGPDNLFGVYGPAIGAAIVTGGGLSGAFEGATAGGVGASAGGGASTLPESYWGMQAAGTGAVSDAPAIGAGTVGSGTGAAGTGAAVTPNGFIAQQLVNLGVPVETANTLATSYQVGSAANTVGQVAGGGGDGGASYTYDPYTGDTVGAGNTPLDSNYFTTNPSLDAPGYGGNPSGGSSGLTGADLLKFAQSGLGSRLIGGGLNALGGYLGSRQQANAAGAANDLLWRQYVQNRDDLTPYRLAGYGALGNVVNMVTPGKQFDQMQLDPGYQFRKQEGQQALDNRLRAGGKFYSGSAIKAGADYNQNFASNEFDKVFNRNAAVAGIGQTATNTGAQLGSSTAQQMGNNTVDMGNARASGYVSGFGGVSNAINQYNNAQQTQQLIDLLSKRV